ncbi:S8 family serine peptidase [Kitasatospora sp. NPDC058444]|uniref:S8 family peptidase n=1 Tax=Kitasatospora sp. NPDC058444 TaxID=3346504 RepID=UPI0036467E23
MCEDYCGYSTVVGPRWQIEWLIEHWQLMRTAERFGIEPPRLIEFRAVGDVGEAAFRDDHSPAIAVVRHAPGIGSVAAHQLQTELMLTRRPRLPLNIDDDRLDQLAPQLLWEPGFSVRPAHGGVPVPDDPFDPEELQRLRDSAPRDLVGPPALGPRVAVLDTGVRDADSPMIDFIECDDLGIRTVPPADARGHGSSVATVIRTVRDTARIHPLRVLRDTGPGVSYEVLAGLIYALWSGEYDLVNASLTTQARTRCISTLGLSIDYVVRYAARRRGPLPVLVAAAGNEQHATSGYPARVPDAIVALASDDSGNPATYNSDPPAGARTEIAYGASESHPLGRLPDGTPLYGTSFATAVVSGAYLP